MLLGIFPGAPAGALDEPAMRVIETLSLGMPRGASAATTNSDMADDANPFCSAVDRSEMDRADLHEGRLVHVIYMVPREASDERLDVNGTLACSVLAQNKWMIDQSGLEWRWDTALVDTATESDPNSRVETLDVTFIRSTQPATALDSAGDVRTELLVRGFDDPDKRYLTYVASGDGAGVCGDAFYPLTHHVGEVDGKYAQVYLDSSEGCGARDFGTPSTGGGLSEAIAQQELMHNDGMTPLGAPHTCGNSVPPLGHVCTGPLFVLPEVDPEGRDVMFPYVWYPLRDKTLDRGNDDYYDHGLPLASLETSSFLQAAGAWGKPIVEPRSPSSPQPKPSPSATSTPVPSRARTVEASATRRRVDAGDRVRIVGAIEGDAACSSDQTVVLRGEDLAKGRALRPVRTTSDAEGSFAFRVSVHGRTRFVVTLPETESCEGARSKPFVVATR